jgi:hypothetical protein
MQNSSMSAGAIHCEKVQINAEIILEQTADQKEDDEDDGLNMNSVDT